MEPRIQYAKTSDGVSIAYWTLGEGRPLLHLPLAPVTHTQMSWQIPEYRRWFEGLARGRTLVLWDWRGCGLSGRGTGDFSLDTLTLDLEAVATEVGVSRFALFAMANSVVLALTYAARCAERVSHLVLWNGYASYGEGEAGWALAPHREVAIRSLDVWAQMMTPIMLGENAPGELMRQVRTMLSEPADAEAFALMLDQTKEWDATPHLQAITSLTLILQRRELQDGLRVARGLATRIRKAQLVVLDGGAFVPFVGNSEAALEAIDEFLDESENLTAQPEPPEAGLVTILFTDIESSTALTQRLGDARAQELVRAHNTIVRDALKAHTGAEVKHTGDGIMASFATASGALECAVTIQRAVAALRQAQGGQADPPIRQAEPTPDQAEPVEAPLRVRIGLNAGEPVAEDDPDGRVDLFGTAVQLARRICDHAQPAQVLASDVVRQLAAGKGFLFSDIGETELRGFEDPVRLYEVRWREDG